MKLAISAILFGSAAAYTAPSMTFAVGKKAAKKAAPKAAGTVPSQALPFEVAPALLDGSMVGDVGFDPCALSTKADTMANYFNGIVGGTDIDGLTWYREAELMHGRIAQLAVVGFIFPGLYHFPGDEEVGMDAFAYTNPLEAPSHIPFVGWLQIGIFAVGLEFRRIRRINAGGSNYIAGDFGWGQFGWNPFGFDYTEEEFAAKQLQETKHGRLAMIALLGLYLQASISGVGVVDQLSPAFTVPEYAGKAGYFLPQGI